MDKGAAQTGQVMRFAALFLTIVLTACGGGGDSPNCTPVAVVKIQRFGDSTGVDIERYSQIGGLQKAMDDRFGPGAVVLENRSTAGMWSTKTIEGADGLNLPWPGSTNADIVIVNHGIQDAGHSIPIETYKANLRTIGRTGLTLFQTPSPLTVSVSTAPYAAAMIEVANELKAPVADVQSYVLGLPSWQTLLMSDGVHPLPALYDMETTNVIAPKVAEMVSALKCK